VDQHHGTWAEYRQRLAWMLAKIGVILLTGAAYVLDFGIRMGAGLPIDGFPSGIYRIQVIADIWTILRDITNMTFIFILVTSQCG